MGEGIGAKPEIIKMRGKSTLKRIKKVKKC